MTTRTREEMHQTMTDRFGPDPLDWSFTCPSCSTPTTLRDFRDALVLRPRTNRDGTPVTAEQISGQECIGRTLGALDKTLDWSALVGAGRGMGCDWAAYGLLPGPDFLTVDDRTIPCFPITEVA